MKSLITLLLFVSISAFAQQNFDDYLREATINNPGLKASYKEFEIAMQRIPQVKALPDPTLSFGLFISPVETRVGPQRIKFSLNQMFPWFGTLKTQGNIAALLAEAKFQSFIDARNFLIYRVSASYYPIIEVNMLAAIEKENIQILESYVTIATKQFESGNGAMVDVLRIDIMLKEAITNFNILNIQKKPLLTNFNLVLNRNEDEEVIVDDSLSLELNTDFNMDSLLVNNPVLKGFEFKVKASVESEKVAIKQGLPKLGVGLDYAIVSKRTDMSVPDNGKNILMPMFSVSIPLFRKKYDAAIKEAQLMQESYTYQKESYSNLIINNYENTGFKIDKERQFINLYNSQINETKQALRLLLIAYSNSGRAFEEVLRMQQQLLKYQKMKVSALAKYNIALAEMDYYTSKSILK